MDIAYRFDKDILIVASPVSAFLLPYISDDRPFVEANILEGEAVLQAHEAQVAAGANCIVANTCGCLSSQLSNFNLSEMQEEICSKALELANEAKPEHVLVELD